MKSILNKDELEQFVTATVFGVLIALVRLIMLRIKKMAKRFTRKLRKQVKVEQLLVETEEKQALKEDSNNESEKSKQ